MVTLKELAKQLEVSISTVSKALHDSDEIGKETIARVKSLAKQLNYKPNRVALSLKQSKTKTIGVIIPNILNHFFAKALYGIEKEASKFGYSIITCLSNELYKSELKSLELLANGSVDGFILSVAEETQIKNKSSHFEHIIDQQIPMVMFDRVTDSVNCDKVIIDDIGAVYSATSHLLKEGRKKIVLLNNIKELNVGKLRVKGYLKALEENNNYKNKPIVIDMVKDNMEEVINRLLEDHKDIDGIISIDNITGVIALNKALKLGIDIPNNLSIIGFSDDNILPFTDPKLSTISQHAEDIGKTAVKVLIQRLNNNEVDNGFKTRIIKTQLQKRGTTI